MRPVVNARNKIFYWFSEKVLGNTITTIVFTAVISGSAPLLLKRFAPEILNLWTCLVFLLFILIYYKLSQEEILYKSNFNKNGLNEWKNNEQRPLGVATIIDGSLFLQYSDMPFTLNRKFTINYAFEFKAKVLTDVFSWTVSSEITKESIKAYMFQYSPFNKTFRPHFLLGYDENTKTTRWHLPNSQGSFLRTINNLELKIKNEWYHIRTEIRIKTIDKIDDRHLQKKFQIKGDDGKDFSIDYNPANFDKLLDIRIYDMNNFGKEFFHSIYREPPFPYLGADQIGFRNCGYESALYKDIIIYRI